MGKGHSLHPTILREYDIRGTVGDNLFAVDLLAIGRAFGTLLVEQGGQTVAVGYDGRHSSPELESALVEGLKACGLTVYRVGCGPSPMLYYSTFALDTDAGLMVTGSHNPPRDNGLKMTLQGDAFFGPDIEKLGCLVTSGDWVCAEGSVIDRPVMDRYIERLLRDFRGTKKLKVAWDPGNGAASEAVQLLTQKLPGQHLLINDVIDGSFPAHHPDPTIEENLEQLKHLVINENCDLGFAFDGDGDRIGVVDSRGRVLWGDQLLVILARAVLADEPGATIIADVKASQVFFDEIKRMGGKPLMWLTGHSHIKNKLAETGAPLAGEMSAHIFFKHRYYGYDDALYVAVRLLEELNVSDLSLDDIYDTLPQMVNTPEIRFECAEERKFDVADEVKALLKSRYAGRDDIIIHEIDGVRVETKDGWWLLRASNTQAALTARCESTTEEGLERLKAELIELLAPSGIIPPKF